MISGNKSNLPAIGESRGDLAPGETKAFQLNLESLKFHSVTGTETTWFEPGYRMLQSEFAPLSEVDAREMLYARMAWNPAQIIDGHSFAYEMIVATREERIVAVRDHSAIIIHGPEPEVIVHLSHVLVIPEWRRTGLAGWLRCYPAQMARTAASNAGFSPATPLSLVAEMQHPDSAHLDRMIGLTAYERGGFLKVDPRVVNYQQPDLRSHPVIDRSGKTRPHSMALVMRRLNHQDSRTISGKELRRIVRALYQMYARTLRPSDMAPMWKALENLPGEETQVPLVAPTK